METVIKTFQRIGPIKKKKAILKFTDIDVIEK